MATVSYVTLKHQVDTLTVEASTKNPKTINEDERRTFFETINKVQTTVKNLPNLDDSERNNLTTTLKTLSEPYEITNNDETLPEPEKWITLKTQGYLLMDDSNGISNRRTRRGTVQLRYPLNGTILDLKTSVKTALNLGCPANKIDLLFQNCLSTMNIKSFPDTMAIEQIRSQIGNEPTFLFQIRQ